MEVGTLEIQPFRVEVPTCCIFMNRLAISLKQGQDFQFKLFLEQGRPKYVFRTVDSENPQKIKEKTFAVFIVPQGQERSWTFSTLEGLGDLVNQISTSRVLYIYLGHGYMFKDLEAVQNELKEVVLSFMPPSSKTARVPFMTNGDIGEKALIYSSGQVIVEDVKEGDYYLRQLIFVSNVNQVQSEVRIEQTNNDDSIFNEDSLLKYPIRANYEFLTFECQRAMLLSLAFNADKSLNESMNVLLLGAGACVFPTFILKFFENFRIEAVDIDPQVVDIGRRFFGVAGGERFSVVIEDAGQYIRGYTGQPYDIAFLDICIGEAGVQTPPPQFTCVEFTSSLSNLIKNDGLLCVNLIGNDSQITKMEQEFKSTFRKVFRCKCRTDTNVIIYCFKEDLQVDWKDVVKSVKVLENSKKWDQTMSLVEYAGWVKTVEEPKSAQSILPAKKRRKKKH